MWIKIKRFFNKALKKLWKMIKYIMTKELERFMAEILDFALDTVKSLMKKQMNTADKRRLAFDAIKKEAEDRCLEYKDSFINKIIEDCVIAVKMDW